MRISLLALMVFVLSQMAFANDVPLCPPTGNASVDLGCQYSVRAREYSQRHWYPMSLISATNAHLLDYLNPGYITQIQDLSDALAKFLAQQSLAAAVARFPDLNLESQEDQLQRAVYYGKRRDLAQATLKFLSFLSAVNLSNWDARVLAGDAALAALTVPQMTAFNQFLEFNISDLMIATAYLQQGHTPSPTCGIFYPLQFGFSSSSTAYLIQAVNAFTDSNCRKEGYRAILAQAFKAPSAAGNGDFIVDSNFISVPFVAGPGTTGESLENPAPVLAARISDTKLMKAITDSVVNEQVFEQKTDIETARMEAFIAGLNQLAANLGVTTDQKIAMYKGLTSYALTQSGLMYLRLAARYGDELKTLEGGRRS